MKTDDGSSSFMTALLVLTVGLVAAAVILIGAIVIPKLSRMKSASERAELQAAEARAEAAKAQETAEQALAAAARAKKTIDKGSGNEEEARHASREEGLRATPEWKLIVQVWENAKDTARGARGVDFPRKKRDEIVASISRACSQLDDLEKSGFLTHAESGLVRMELSFLSSEIVRVIWCREDFEEQKPHPSPPPTPIPEDYSISLGYLEQRLCLLEGLAAQSNVSAEVLGKVLPSIESRLNALAGVQQERMAKTVQKARSLFEAIREKNKTSNSSR